MAGKSEDGTNPEVHIWRIAPTRRDLLGVLGWGAVRNGELFVITYTAPRLAFFQRHLASAEAIVKSARLR